jgi:hypothetical protein
MNEGDPLEMTEYILQEKELEGKIRKLVQQMQEPVARLKRAKAILGKAQAAFDAQLAVCKPLQSDKMLLEGELELLLEKKSDLRREARLRQGGGIRPGTQALVEQMTKLGGDPEEARLTKETVAADVEAELAALKKSLEGA